MRVRAGGVCEEDGGGGEWRKGVFADEGEGGREGEGGGTSGSSYAYPQYPVRYDEAGSSGERQAQADLHMPIPPPGSARTRGKTWLVLSTSRANLVLGIRGN